MGDRFLVTGATGLVGNNVVRLLLSQGHAVRTLVRERSDPRPLAGLSVELTVGDICDPQSVQAACRDVCCVVHAAGYVQLGRSRMELHQAINVEGSRIVAQQTRAAGARMIHVSSCDAMGVRSLEEPADEDTPLAKPVACNYVITKRAAEQVVLQEHAAGLDVVIVNPAFMLGPWDWKPSSGRMLLEIARGRGLFAPQGHMSVCDVRDVAAAILAAVQQGQNGCRYILAGPTLSYLDAWRLFARVTGGRRPWLCPGPIVLWLAGHAGDLVTLVTGNEPDVNSGALALAKLPKHYCSQRAGSELGYQTRPFEQTVQDAWNWFREYGYA